MTKELLFSLLVVASLTGCRKKADADDAGSSEKPIAVVQAEHPTLGSITEEISADAVLAPVAQAAILPKITAPVRKFYVQRGSIVKAGQLLATLENRDLAAAAQDTAGVYQAAQGTYQTAIGSTVPQEQTKARTDLDQAKATLDLDNAIVRSRQQLFTQGAIPGRDLDTAKATAVQAQAAYDVALQHFQAVQKTGTTAALAEAKGQLASAKGKLAGAEAQLSYTEIRSPISGVVTDRTLFAGETASSGSPLITVVDTSFMLAKLHIAQAQAQRLQIGAPATMIVPGLDDPVDAKVSLISPALDPGSTTVEVWLKAANSSGKLKAGTPLHVEIKGRTLSNVLLVPTQSVQRSSEGEGKIVLVISSQGTVAKRTVVTGIATEEETQVVSGLKPEDTVITGGGYGLDEGTRVTVGPAQKNEDDKGSSESSPATGEAVDDDKKAGKR